MLEEEQPDSQAMDVDEERRDPNLGLIRFKARKLLGVRHHDDRPGCLLNGLHTPT